MALRFFTIPVRDPDSATEELNAFLAGHKVVSLRKKFVDRGDNSFWSVCVDYTLATTNRTTAAANLSRSRVDYKTILPQDEFAVFSKLREMRKELGLVESVPLYALFTNEQFAQMVQRRCRTKAELLQIEGLAEPKIDKYLSRLLPLLSTLEPKPDAPSEQSV